MMKRIILSLSLVVGLLCAPQAQVMMIGPADSLSYITSPLDLDSLFYWFAADQGVTDSLGGTIATNEGVGTWADLSGNNYNVTQTTNGARPVYKATGGAGSKPCIQFDGTNDFLASAAHWWGSDDLTVFVVMKFGNATRDAQEFFLGKYETSSPANSRSWAFQGQSNVSSAEYRMNFQGSDDGTNTAGQFWTYAYNPKSTTWKLHSFSDDNTSTTTNKLWYEDGASVSVVAGRSTQAKDGIFDSNATKLGIGAINATSVSALHFQGSISEIIVYSRALTATERAAIETYLNKKYDLY